MYKLKGNSTFFKKKKSKINPKELSLALSDSANCGTGIDVKKGFVSLPNFNSSSGDKDGFYGFYVVDGELVVDTVTNIRNEINNFCNGSGGGGEPQALRLTFDNIENANLLVGDASNVSDWNTFFDLPNLGGPFTSAQINGNVVLLLGGSNIKVKPGLMYNPEDNTYQLLSIDDQAGCITSVGGDAFSYCYALTDVNLPACTIIYGPEDSPFNDTGGFGGCVTLTNFSAPLLEEIGGSGLSSNLLTTINFPNLTTVGYLCFGGCLLLTTINIPSCTYLGSTIVDDVVFIGIIGNNITLTVPAALMTANSGSPDGDIAYLQANNTVTVITV